MRGEAVCDFHAGRRTVQLTLLRCGRKMLVMKNIIPMLVTAGGKVVCARCTAKSKRSGEQCKKPALKSSRTQKCQFHGGLSRGPVTAEGKARSALANYRTGEYTKAEIDQADRSRALLRVLEDATQLLGMVPTDTPRTRGRPPRLYQPVRSPEGVLSAILDLQENQT